MSRALISKLGGFWSVDLNGYTFLFDKDDFAELTKPAKEKHSEDDWLQFLIAVSSFSRLSNARLHSAIHQDAIKSIQDYFDNDPDAVLEYEFAGGDAIKTADAFLEACVSCPASKGLFTRESLEIDGRDRWILREYYPQSLMERARNQKRLAKTVTIAPDDIDCLVGNSTNFRVRVSGQWMRICTEGIRSP